MVRTRISLDKALYEAAKRAARRQGTSVAELCRRSVAEALARQDTGNVHPWTRYLGITDGRPGDSTSVDDGARDTGFGLWGHKAPDGLTYQRRVRSQWSKRVAARVP